MAEETIAIPGPAEPGSHSQIPASRRTLLADQIHEDIRDAGELIDRYDVEDSKVPLEELAPVVRAMRDLMQRAFEPDGAERVLKGLVVATIGYFEWERAGVHAEAPEWLAKFCDLPRHEQDWIVQEIKRGLGPQEDAAAAAPT